MICLTDCSEQQNVRNKLLRWKCLSPSPVNKMTYALLPSLREGFKKKKKNGVGLLQPRYVDRRLLRI